VKRRRRGWSPDNHAYQHRSPDPTKIERATATSTAALFFLLANPRAVNKKAVTYHKWCGSSESGPRGSPFSIPSYLYKDLDKHVLRNFSRFRLRAHHLRVESCKWHGGSSICNKCECGEVQDEKHVLFFCKCAEVCELRMRYRDLFEGMFKTLRAFAPSSSEFIPFLACHHSITDFEINAFLNQDSYRLLKFVSDLVSIFDTG